jgi:hypothetical protein
MSVDRGVAIGELEQMAQGTVAAFESPDRLSVEITAE